MSYSRCKRLLDITGAIFGLLVFAGPMAVIACVIKLRMGSPVLCRIVRPGLHGGPFVLFKFRTMKDVVDAAGTPLPDRDRVTPVGRLLRRTSLDELPQLFNVLKGEMSLVGPRPLNVAYLNLYTVEQARRHNVKPGITGLAQISGRNTLSWERRLQLDVDYADHASLLLDSRILLQTIFVVVRREGVRADGDLDVPFFRGSPSSDTNHDVATRS